MSRTFQLAVLQAAIGVLVVFSTSYPTIGWLLTAKSILDVILRINTTQPISGLLG